MSPKTKYAINQMWKDITSVFTMERMKFAMTCVGVIFIVVSMACTIVGVGETIGGSAQKPVYGLTTVESTFITIGTGVFVTTLFGALCFGIHKWFTRYTKIYYKEIKKTVDEL